MNLSLAYSPCPNDTFAFHAMINGLIDTEGLSFSVTLQDVEALNKSAKEEIFDICKLSYHAFFYLFDKYAMLHSGSALGYNNGPLLVCRKESSHLSSNSTIAIPGVMTTGALLMKIAFPEYTNRYPVLFSEIADMVSSGKFDAGVLIHEGRFTYKDKGLELIADLGEIWQERYSSPIPLGGIAASRKIGADSVKKIERVLKRSILFAMENPHLSEEYVVENAKEIEKSVQKKHIQLFVNKFSVEIGEEGMNAVKTLHHASIQTDPELLSIYEKFRGLKLFV